MNKTVLVTGSSQGLGASIIKYFASKGYNVIINYNTSEISAFKLKEEIESLYKVRSLVIKCDIAKEEEVISMKESILKEFGSLDVLVNNAAVEITSEIADKNYDSFKKLFDTNVFGTFLVTKIIGEILYNNKNGRIITISSNNSLDKYDPSTMEYDASKAAVNSISLNFSKLYAPYVNVNVVAPGWIKTDKVMDLNNYLDGKLEESESKKIMLKRFAEPIEIAKTVYFLASEESSYITGQIIRVDGGC